MVWLGVIIVVLSILAILKRFDSRMILFVSGLLMCIIGHNFLPALDKFLSSMFTGALPQQICSAMGYAYLMSYTKCDWNFAVWLVSLLKKIRATIMPGSIIAIGLVIFALLSNGGTAAAVGPVFIPVMIKAGIHPAMAATAAAMGASGSYWSFANPHSAMIAQIAGVDVTHVVMAYTWPVGAAAYIMMIIWAIFYSKWKKEDKGYVDESSNFHVEDNPRIDPYKAFLPFLPIILILIGVFHWGPVFSVPQAMLISTCWGMLSLRINPESGIKAITSGMGRALADIMSIIACAGVFTLGMEKIGLTPALINAMKSNPSIAIYGSAIGTWLIGTLCGSGDAPTLAFNGSITPLVASIGLDPEKIGVVAHLGGCFGRTMSPVAGVTIICAGIAKVDPIEITKRIMLPALLSVVADILLVGYIL